MLETLMPLIILLVGVIVVIGMIIVLRVNAFIALIAAALLVSLLSPGSLAQKVSRVAEAFGTTCGKIGIVIALAAVIGKCLMDSGAADRIVRSFLRVLGEKQASIALMGSGFVLSIPVFFDTVFYLLVPLARSLYRRTKTNYVLYVTAIATGGALTHTLVPPTPGPLIMADALGIDMGFMIMMGCLVGLPTALVGLLFCRAINKRMDIAMRPYSDQEEPEPLPDENLPSLWVSLLPVVVPVLLISANTVVRPIAEASRERLLQQGEILDWPGLTDELTKVEVDAEPCPARRVYELFSPELRQSLATLIEEERRQSLATLTEEEETKPDLREQVTLQVKSEVSRLVKENEFLTDPAFLGITLSEEARELLDSGAEGLPEEDAARYKKHYRDKAFNGRALPDRGVELLTQGLNQLPEKDRERMNWLVLEAAFPGQVRRTDAQKVFDVTAVIGNANFALFIATIIAMVVLVRSRKLSLKELGKATEVALMSGGVIILITAGGGAFGAMLKQAGVQDSIEQFVGTEGQSVGLVILLAAAATASVMKFAQGSGTVSMITTVSIFAAMGITSETLGCDMVYLALAIGSGSLIGSWMNDSGFWIFARMSVLTEVEGLKSWTILLALLGVTSLAITLLLSQVLPMAG